MVPKQGIGVSACAQAVANSECVCATPPIFEKVFVQLEMRRQVRRRTKVPVNDFPREIGNHNLARREFFIGNAARLDRNQSFAAVNPADIAKGIQYKPAANQFQIRFQHLFAQCFQQHVDNEILGFGLDRLTFP